MIHHTSSSQDRSTDVTRTSSTALLGMAAVLIVAPLLAAVLISQPVVAGALAAGILLRPVVTAVGQLSLRAVTAGSKFVSTGIAVSGASAHGASRE